MLAELCYIHPRGWEIGEEVTKNPLGVCILGTRGPVWTQPRLGKELRKYKTTAQVAISRFVHPFYYSPPPFFPLLK